MKVFEAVAYFVKTGGQWADIPRHFNFPHTTVYYHFREWSKQGSLQRFLARLVKARRRCRKQPSMIPAGRRWVVERTFAWLENYRRMCRNYEKYKQSALTMTYFSAVLFMLSSA